MRTVIREYLLLVDETIMPFISNLIMNFVFNAH